MKNKIRMASVRSLYQKLRGTWEVAFLENFKIVKGTWEVAPLFYLKLLVLVRPQDFVTCEVAIANCMIIQHCYSANILDSYALSEVLNKLVWTIKIKALSQFSEYLYINGFYIQVCSLYHSVF